MSSNEANGRQDRPVEATVGPVTLGELSVIAPRDAENFALHCDRLLSMQQRDAIQQSWQHFMPGRKLLIIDAGMRLSVVADEQPNAGHKPRA